MAESVVVSDVRSMEEAARRWRTDLLKMACGSGGEGWGRMGLAKLRWLARVCARVSDGFRCVFDWRSSSAVGELFDSVGCGVSSEIDFSAVAAVGISLSSRAAY